MNGQYYEGWTYISKLIIIILPLKIFLIFALELLRTEELKISSCYKHLICTFILSLLFTVMGSCPSARYADESRTCPATEVSPAASFSHNFATRTKFNLQTYQQMAQQQQPTLTANYAHLSNPAENAAHS